MGRSRIAISVYIHTNTYTHTHTDTSHRSQGQRLSSTFSKAQGCCLQYCCLNLLNNICVYNFCCPHGCKPSSKNTVQSASAFLYNAFIHVSPKQTCLPYNAKLKQPSLLAFLNSATFGDSPSHKKHISLHCAFDTCFSALFKMRVLFTIWH